MRFILAIPLIAVVMVIYTALAIDPNFSAGSAFTDMVLPSQADLFLTFGDIFVILGLVGIALTFPIADKFREAMGTLFPIFYVSDETLVMQLAAAILVGAIAASLPAWRAAHVRIVDGLRAVG